MKLLKNRNKQFLKNKKHRVFLSIMSIFSIIGFFAMSFTFSNSSLINSANNLKSITSQQQVGNLKNSNKSNSLFSSTNNVGASSQLGATPNMNFGGSVQIYNITKPTSLTDAELNSNSGANNGFNWALGAYQNIRTNFPQVLTISVFDTWIKSMIQDPIFGSAQRTSFFTNDKLDPVIDALNKTNVIMTSTDELIFQLPTKGIVNLLDGTTSAIPTTAAIAIAQFNVNDNGLGVIGIVNSDSSTANLDRVVLDNTNGDLANGITNSTIANGYVFARENNHKYNPSQPLSPISTLSFSQVDSSGLCTVYAIVSTATPTIRISAPDITGVSATKISSFKIGLLAFDMNGVVTTTQSIPLYSQEVEPTVSGDNVNVTLYLRKGTTFLTTLKSQDAVVVQDFDIKYDGSKVIYNTNGKDTSNPNISIDDTIWQPNKDYSFNIVWSLSSASGDYADKQFAKVDISYKKDSYNIADVRNLVDLDDQVQTYYYQSSFIENPIQATYGQTTTETANGVEKTDPDKLVKQSFARVFGTWTSTFTDLSNINRADLTLSYQAVTWDGSDPETTKWDDSPIEYTKLTGTEVYNQLVNQYKTQSDILVALYGGTNPPVVHGVGSNSTWYEPPKAGTVFITNIQDIISSVLQPKIFDYVSDSVSTPALTQAKELLKNYSTIEQIPTTDDTYTQLEKLFVPIIQSVMEKDLTAFKLQIYSRVYGAYAKSINDPKNSLGQNPQLFSDNTFNNIAGDVDKHTNLLTTNNLSLIQGDDSGFNLQTSKSIFDFINKYDLGKVLFPDPELYGKFKNVSNSSWYLDPQIFTNASSEQNPDQRAQANDVFAVYNELFNWLDVKAIGQILTLSLALDPTKNLDKISSLFKDALQEVIVKLVDTTPKFTTDAYGTMYSASTVQILVTNNNILSSLNDINLNNRSELYLANLASIKTADFRNIEQSKRFALATQNFIINDYISNFTNGSKTIYFSNQIKNLDFNNPNLFVAPAPASATEKILQSTRYVMFAVFEFIGISSLILGAIAITRKSKFLQSTLVNNKFSRTLIWSSLIVLIIFGVVLITIGAMYMGGALNVIPFVKT